MRLMIFLLCFTACIAKAETHPAVILMDNPEPGKGRDSTVTRLANLVYQEAFARLGYHYETKAYPPLRAIMLAEQGQLDGLVHRGKAFQDTHPELMRVDEPIGSIRLSAYSRDPDMRLSAWQDLHNTAYMVSYHLGVEYLAVKLTPLVPADNLDAVPPRNGLRQLLAGHADMYIGVASAVSLLLKDAEFHGQAIYELGMLAEIPMYPYLHRKHADLAPRLAEVLRSMKAEGRFSDYLQRIKQQP